MDTFFDYYISVCYYARPYADTGGFFRKNLLYRHHVLVRVNPAVGLRLHSIGLTVVNIQSD